jgi:hypothetical protein
VTVPTVLKCQSDNEYQQDPNNWFDNPLNIIELEDEEEEEVYFRRNSSRGLSITSPGYFICTPSNNPYGYFQNSATPHAREINLASIGVIQNSEVNECQLEILQELSAKGKN